MVSRRSDFKSFSVATRLLFDQARDCAAPICTQLENGNYVIGARVINHDRSEGTWEVDNIKFPDKKLAIYYAALMHLHRDEHANNIKFNYWLIAALVFEKSVYREKLNAAFQKNDTWRVDLCSAKLDGVAERLASAKAKQKQLIADAHSLIVSSFKPLV